jgi:hypothetical protein
MAITQISKTAKFANGTAPTNVELDVEVFYVTQKVTIKDKTGKDFRIQDAPKELIPNYTDLVIEINDWVATELP